MQPTVLRERWGQMVSVAGGMAAGAIAFRLCVGLSVVDPRAVGWIFQGGVDPSIHFIGWHMFRAAPWSLPPGLIPTLGYPVGTSVGLTDSIPVVAIGAKAIRGLLPETFQYLGLWLLLCFVLQGLFGALLVGTVTRRPLLRILGASLFVLAFVLANRLNHAALCAHWLILAALWLARRPTSHLTGWRQLTAWSLLIAAVSGVHPYLTVMVLAIAGAALLGRPGPWVGSVARAAVSMLVLGGVALAVWWACGYFIVPDSLALDNSGFGRLSTNLLSPLIPPEGAFLYGRIPLATAWYDQHEGFAYLGLGVFSLTVLALALATPRVPRVRADVMLVLACLVLFLFALSPVVTIGTHTLVAYRPEWWGPLATFRASGRMIWPVVYAGLFAAVAVVSRRLRPTGAAVALAGAVALQVIDIQGVYRLKHAGYAHPPDSPLQSDFWRVVPRYYRHVVLYPSNMCGPMAQSLDYRFFALHAGHVGATINGGYAARYDIEAVRAYCDTLAAEMRRGYAADDTLYVLGAGLESLLRAPGSVACVRVDGYSVCFTVSSHAAWAGTFILNDRHLPPVADFTRFRDALEAEYRDRMRRASSPLPGTIHGRLDTLVRYLAYRMGGCGVSEASGYALSRAEGMLCRDQAVEPLELPDVRELREVHTAVRRSEAAATPSYVDAEGEVVWTHAYARLRRAGRSEQQATAEVLAAIRTVTGS